MGFVAAVTPRASSLLFLQPPMFARCPLRSCYPPGGPALSTQPQSLAFLCSLGSHTMRKAFLMKPISTEQPRGHRFKTLSSPSPCFFHLDPTGKCLGAQR